jgi:DNA polymerase III psi subunit
MGALELKDSILKSLNTADENLLKIVKETIDNYNEDEIVTHSVEGKPLTRKQYKQKISDALLDFKKGNHTTQEDLEKEIESW